MRNYDFIAVEPLVRFITSTRDLYAALSDQEFVRGHRDACETFLTYIEALTGDEPAEVAA